MIKITKTERYEICTLCGGRGQESAYGNQGNLTAAMLQTCRSCAGLGRKLIEVIETTETINEENKSSE